MSQIGSETRSGLYLAVANERSDLDVGLPQSKTFLLIEIERPEVAVAAKFQ